MVFPSGFGRSLRPNRWDLIALPIVLGLVALIAWASRQMSAPYNPGQPLNAISLAWWHLPEYAGRSVMRMALALVASLIFTFTYATLAAKSARAEKILIPVLDILQSVPILGFLSITVAGFIALFNGNLIGVECASIFAIFTSQAWNMAFSFYQSLKTVPRDLAEASSMFGLSPWARFWKLEVPFATPSLIWNMMMSVSGGWFFVVASEAITVGRYNVSLPGIGSYVARAIIQKDILAIVWALLAMLLVILAYDQLLFRPLVAWAEKFRLGDTAAQYEPRSWVLDLFRRTRFLRNVAPIPGVVVGTLTARSRARRANQVSHGESRRLPGTVRLAARRAMPIVIYAVVAAGTAWGLWNLISLVAGAVSVRDALHVLVLGFYTLVRVLVLLAIASAIWIPVGVYVGLNARLSVRAQPVAQFLAAFPANLFFPIAVIVMVRFNLTPEIFTAPLMVLGTQWYILFNVIAGAAAIPIDLREAARTFGLSPWQRWRTLYLPGIFPYLVTGLLTASGGTWNASIVAEVVSWGNNTLTASGLGSYIADATLAQNYGKIVLGIVVMSIYVVALNHFVWRRLYRLANSRFRLA